MFSSCGVFRLHFVVHGNHASDCSSHYEQLQIANATLDLDRFPSEMACEIGRKPTSFRQKPATHPNVPTRGVCGTFRELGNRTDAPFPRRPATATDRNRRGFEDFSSTPHFLGYLASSHGCGKSFVTRRTTRTDSFSATSTPALTTTAGTAFKNGRTCLAGDAGKRTCYAARSRP